MPQAKGASLDKRHASFPPVLLIPLVLVLFLALCALVSGISKVEGDRYACVQDLDGKRIGIQIGTSFDEFSHTPLPNAELMYFNSYTDMAEALLRNKIDAFPGDEPAIRMIVAANRGLAVLEDPMDSFEFGVVFAKNKHGRQLQQEFNGWLADMRESGELERLKEKWVYYPEEEKTILDYRSLPATNGVLHMVTDATYPPMEYYRDGRVVGLDVEVAARFCEARGYGLEVDSVNFDAIVPAVQSGKADFSLSSLPITKERAERVYFSDAYYLCGTIMAVRKADLAEAADDEDEAPSFWEGLVESFTKTFVREDRWKLFGEGVVVTLIITVLSAILGTALGFVVFVLCRNGGPVAQGITGFCMWLVQGMPVVVLLMILYYVVFGSFAIGGIAVSVVCFTMTFGTSVFALIKMGVATVDDGQREAAFAMGYSDHQTFFKIILPQALPHVMPAYKGELVSLIKATAVVGYIAVLDLTKMGDLVRSRTYEAFFPLIAVTIIYFLLEGLIGFVAGRLIKIVDPRHRSRNSILKGVKTDD